MSHVWPYGRSARTGGVDGGWEDYTQLGLGIITNKPAMGEGAQRKDSAEGVGEEKKN